MEELTKEQLEIKRLQIQIENDKKPLYKKLSFYSALSPIAVSIVAIIYSITSGFFETESKLLDLRKENLKHEISVFEQQKDSLISEISNLKSDKDSIISEYNSLMSEYRKLEIAHSNLSSIQTELNYQIHELKDSVSIKQKNLTEISNKYIKLTEDKTQLASKMKELEEAIQSQLRASDETRRIFKDILAILDESLGGFGSGSMLLLFGD